MDEMQINEAFFSSLSGKVSSKKEGKKSRVPERKGRHPERSKYNISANSDLYEDIVRQQRLLFFGMLLLCIILMIKLARK